MDESDDVVEAYPVASVSLTVVVGAVAYAAVSALMRGTFDPTETGLFAVAFAAVYVVFAFYSETIASVLGAE